MKVNGEREREEGGKGGGKGEGRVHAREFVEGISKEEY